MLRIRLPRLSDVASPILKDGDSLKRRFAQLCEEEKVKDSGYESILRTSLDMSLAEADEAEGTYEREREEGGRGRGGRAGGRKGGREGGGGGERGSTRAIAI